ncbi:MAG: hypothetical protein JXR88_17345, partial [Clostridia bacterium]|nr:hypothetical protein [Clostridia bacterium]
KVFGEKLTNEIMKNENDFVKILDVEKITQYEKEILKQGGNLTVPTMRLDANKRVAYFSDPNGNLFALLENGNS